MEYARLGKSSLSISKIGFGCMSLDSNSADTAWLIHRAIEAGINFFDTADLYDKGLNEEMLGRVLDGKRDQVILATKVGNQWRPDGTGWDWNPRKDYIMKAADQSLQRLHTDRIDLYQLHGGTISDPIDETIEAFETLIEQGKIRYYGISSIRPDVIREYVRRSGIVSVMMQYSLLDRRPEESCLPLLLENGVGVLARGALAKGLLAGKAPAPFLNYSQDQVAAAAKSIAEGSSPLRSTARTALQFVLSEPSITAAVTGLRTLEQLDDVAGAIDPPLLTSEELKSLQGILPVNYYDQHR